jgi:hypothetical protein
MGSFYRPQMPEGERHNSKVYYKNGTPAFNAYYKWSLNETGVKPHIFVGRLAAPVGWEPPEDWTYSDETGFWYTPKEMTDAGYVQQDGEWLHKNEIKRREVERQNAELEAKISRIKATQGRMRDVYAKGRGRTILTSAGGVQGGADVVRSKLNEAKGVLK